MKELLTTALFLAAAAGAANAQGVPGMPSLTRPVSAPQEVSADEPRVTTQGGALALAAPRSLPAPATTPKKGSGVTQQMVDRSKKNDVPPVPEALASAAIERPIWPASASIDDAASLANEVGYQRNQIMPTASTPGEIMVRPGRNEMIQVAKDQINRFVTPFARPDVKTTSQYTTSEVKDNIVYVATSETRPVALFIVDLDNPMNAISLTVVPRDIPAVSTILRMDEYAAPSPVVASTGSSRDMGSDGGDEFVATLRETFRSIAMGEIPSGYGMKRLKGYSDLMPECIMPGLQAAPAQEIANGSVIVVVSKLTNRTNIPQSVDESTCASDKVVAVAAWPHVELMPGQSTELYVAMRRNAPAPSNARPSVL